MRSTGAESKKTSIEAALFVCEGGAKDSPVMNGLNGPIPAGIHSSQDALTFVVAMPYVIMVPITHSPVRQSIGNW
jgi:hypothetical protein